MLLVVRAGSRSPERPTVDDVEACQVTKVGEEHTTSDDIEKCRPGVVEDPLDGLEDHLGLGLVGFTDDLTLPGGSLAGDEHESASATTPGTYGRPAAASGRRICMSG
jgi:hypothetical protein